MKKLISILLVVFIVLTSGAVTAYAEAYDDSTIDVFELFIGDKDTKITLSWEKVDTAEYYEVFIDSNVEYQIVRENVIGTTYEWVPDSYITPNDRFVITVYARDRKGATIAQSDVLDVTVMPVNCDYLGIYGDIDEDKDISVLDATYIQKYLVQSYDFDAYKQAKADVDRDYKITIVDATYIQLFCAGIFHDGSATGETFWLGTLEFDVMIN